MSDPARVVTDLNRVGSVLTPQDQWVPVTGHDDDGLHTWGGHVDWADVRAVCERTALGRTSGLLLLLEAR